MRVAIIVMAVLLGACARVGEKGSSRGDTLAVADQLSRDSSDSLLRAPRVVDAPAVVVFWLRSADSLAADDQADTFDDLRYYTGQIAPFLADNKIALLATRADTLYVSLPNEQRRMIVLSGLDYPFGYVLVDPGGPERILTGVYSDDELLDELRAYFDISDDSTAAIPRATT
jgi:hypothetical protein